jgi:hypothetical protein
LERTNEASFEAVYVHLALYIGLSTPRPANLDGFSMKLTSTSSRSRAVRAGRKDCCISFRILSKAVSAPSTTL